jgi:acetyl esterase
MNISEKAENTESGPDPKAREILDLLNQIPPLYEFTPQEARAMGDTPDNPFALGKRDLDRVIDRTIPGGDGVLPIRIYYPEPVSKGPSPAMVFFHGGGFVIGSIVSHDMSCMNLSADAGCIVISVGYRLAPETKFPGAVDDAFSSFCWVCAHADELGIKPGRIAVGGDSAGANLAAVTTIRCRDEMKPAPVFQLLCYPVTDLVNTTVSRQAFSEGYYLTKKLIEWFFSHYIEKDEQKNDPHVSPLLTPDLGNLPPALVLTAGFDPLRDEGKAYADRLVKAGGRATHLCYTNMIHGFLSFGGVLPQGKEALKRCGESLQKAFRV